jgi:5-methylcytosine-specific restriction endonuclease McrA
MTIGLKTRKMLWGRSGGLCAICREPLFEDESETDDPSVLGEECHIVAREKDGPRGDDPLPEEKRDLYANLILLCLKHHKIIDDQPDKYPVPELLRIKQEQETWLRDASGKFDKNKQQDEEVYAQIIETWAQMADLDHWDGMSYCICSGDAPFLSKVRADNFEALHDWLFKRVYPTRYPLLNDALENFRLVLMDFNKVFRSRLDLKYPDRNTLVVEKFYKIDHWNEELYERLGNEYEAHVEFIEDLFLEMTRAANFVCEKVREVLLRSYRMKEGNLIVHAGTWADGHDHMLRVQYKPEEKTARPYPGRKVFESSVRFQRSFFFGKQPGSKEQ